jgi:hypothetical protein
MTPYYSESTIFTFLLFLILPTATGIDTSAEESDGEAYEEDDRELVVAVVSLIDGFRIQELNTTQNRQKEARRHVTVVVDKGHGTGFITWQAPREAFQEKNRARERHELCCFCGLQKLNVLRLVIKNLARRFLLLLLDTRLRA